MNFNQWMNAYCSSLHSSFFVDLQIESRNDGKKYLGFYKRLATMADWACIRLAGAPHQIKDFEQDSEMLL